MHVTFVGHQGWHVAAGGTNVLIDPLLSGDGEVFPPREIRAALLEPIDAIVCSHEHTDHFDMATLAVVDRRVPIYLSSLSSSSARRVVEEMGFSLHLLSPEVPVRIGALELTTFAPDHVNCYTLDEWDTMPFLVTDQEGGRFFSVVDASLSEAVLRAIKRHASGATLVALACNVTNFTWADRSGRAAASTTWNLDEDFIERVVRWHAALASMWSPPAGIVLTGSGFALDGDDAWVNELLFPVDLDAVTNGLGSRLPDVLVSAPRPGQRFAIDGARLARATDSAWVLARPEAEWPSRVFRPERVAPARFSPLCKEGRLDAADITRLESELGLLAKSLYGSSIFRALYSLAACELDGREPTFVLALECANGPPRVYAYAPGSCDFVRVSAENASDRHVLGFSCWAADLLATLVGDVEVHRLLAGHFRYWVHRVEGKLERFDFHTTLIRHCHPLYRPDAALAFYRRRWAEADATVQVRHAEGG